MTSSDTAGTAEAKMFQLSNTLAVPGGVETMGSDRARKEKYARVRNAMSAWCQRQAERAAEPAIAEACEKGHMLRSPVTLAGGSSEKPPTVSSGHK